MAERVVMGALQLLLAAYQAAYLIHSAKKRAALPAVGAGIMFLLMLLAFALTLLY